MEEFLSIFLNKKSKKPIYQQLGEALYGLIDDGVLQKDSKLPPIRKMASALRVNSVTVVNAYKYLENRKAVYCVVGSGTYVSPFGSIKTSKNIINNALTEDADKNFSINDAINLSANSTPVSLFPHEDFKILFNKILDRDKGNAFICRDFSGYKPLRETICCLLANYGIKADAEQTRIVSGVGQGSGIIAKTLLNPGDVVLVENPANYGALGAFYERGCQIIDVHMQHDGMDLEQLENLLKLHHPKLIYITPYYQTPLGAVYSLQKKRSILQLAEKYNCHILEEDSCADFNYAQEKVIPLKALDYKNKVIYMKNFTNVLTPAVKLSCIVMPAKTEHTQHEKYVSDMPIGLMQRALHLHIESGRFKEHVERMRQIYKLRCETAIRYADEHLGDYISYEKPGGGLGLWLEFNQNIDTVQLCSMLAAKKVVVAPGNMFSLHNRFANCLRLSFAMADESQIEQGIKIISQTVKKC